MKRKFSISILFLVISVVLFGTTLALNAKVSTVGENCPIGPVQTFEKAQPVQADFDDKATPSQTMGEQISNNLENAKTKVIQPTDNRPFQKREYSNDEVRANKSDLSQKGNSTTIKNSTNPNYYAVYDEYIVEGENYESKGQTFIFSNQPEFIQEQLKNANKEQTPIKSILQISCDKENTKNENNQSSQKDVSASTPVYEIITVKKYPHADKIMSAIAIISMFSVIGYIGYLIYKLIKA
ncbi:MAG: hypothetical protein PHP83_01665 [Clostridia bacterium]|nr:hypothetical protein [Clostridia bacterium]